MKILHVVNISFVIPYFLGKQLLHFSKKGNEEYVICSPSKELDAYSKELGFTYQAVNILREINISGDIKALIKTMKYIKKVKPDIVVGHTPKGGLIAMISAFLMRVPKRIYFRHGLVYETSTGFKRKLLITIDRLVARLATRVVCVSDSVYKRSLEDKLNSAKKQLVLSKGTCNGIETDRFNRDNIDKDRLSELSASLGIDKDDWVIGFTGRLVKDKGIIELVRAFNKIRQKHQNVKLMLIGMLEIRDALPEDVVKTIREDENIISTGFVEYLEIEYYYALMNVFVLPSYREGFPTSVLEASSMKLPVITTKVTGCIDSIIDNKTGLFIDNYCDDLVAKLEMLYDNPDKCKELGNGGRAFVEDNFKQEFIWNEIEKLYK